MNDKTYTVVVESGSEFDKSFSWFLEQSIEQSVSGLIVACELPNSWYLRKDRKGLEAHDPKV